MPTLRPERSFAKSIQSQKTNKPVANLHSLIAIFDEIRGLVLREGNSFAFSGWADSSEACTEIDQVWTSLRSEDFVVTSQLTFLFLPTGPLQELSISSGWGDEFIELVNRFDEAIQAEECICFQSTQQKEVPFSVVGMTDDFADISLGKCPKCGQVWLRYVTENEGYTGSGRWYLGAISDLQANMIQVNQAKALLEGLEWYWVGGSYFSGQIRVSRGKIL